MRAPMIVMLALAARATEARAGDEAIRFDVGMTGATVPSTDGGGTGFIAEIKDNVSDHVAIGGRVDLTVLFGGHVRDADLPFGMSAAGLLKAEYLVGTAAVRPFVGLGAGMYAMASYTIGDSGAASTTGHYLGVAPELGLDLGRVRVAATYNAMLGTSVEYRRNGGTGDYAQRYLSFELDVRFGSARR